MEILPFDAALGAEIRCGDVHQASNATIAQIRQASLDHLVLLIRAQTLSDAQLCAFGKHFGELQLSNPLPSPLANEGKVAQGRRDERYPEVTVVSNVIENGVALGGLGDGELVWHTDMSSFAAPPNQTILHALEVPASGGRTGFLNMYRAYETLPPALKTRVRDLKLKHDSTIDAAGYVRKPFAKDADIDLRAGPGSEHPLLRTHPETRSDCLYLGRRTRAFIVGMEATESEALLDELWAHATQHQFVWRHDWRVGDVLMWDNRCTMHHREPFDASARRHLHRMVVKGSVPVLASLV
ncbi:MAG: TauD/TfdA family dioxygenase [Betaproteobacteria bacterium]|nr:TauD/TfdA family dioxygenase [Betaproteobacteria bacterium]